MLRTALGIWPLVLGLAAVAVPAVRAQEVNWRANYQAARKEAEEKNKPIMLDFGTESCFWCKRLDASTFKDPAVVGLLNDQFIPLKVDAEKELQLAQSLKIASYPTLVMASPDGKILGTIVGFKEAAEFHGILQRVLASAVTPDWMTRDHQEAVKAVAAADFARGIALLKVIAEDGKDRPVQVKAKQLLQEIEQQAAARVARAKQAEEKNQHQEAIDLLTEVQRVFPGSQAAGEAGQKLNALASRPEIKSGQRTRRARELLAQAKEDYRTQQYLCCLDRCEALAANYADLPEGAEAVQLAGEIKNNPEWMKAASESASDRLGLLWLSLAETWLRKGEPQQAAQYLERILQSFPGTRQAEAAQVRLSYLKGQPTTQVDFKRQ